MQRSRCSRFGRRRPSRVIYWPLVYAQRFGLRLRLRWRAIESIRPDGVFFFNPLRCPRERPDEVLSETPQL